MTAKRHRWPCLHEPDADVSLFSKIPPNRTWSVTTHKNFTFKRHYHHLLPLFRFSGSVENSSFLNICKYICISSSGPMKWPYFCGGLEPFVNRKTGPWSAIASYQELEKPVIFSGFYSSLKWVRISGPSSTRWSHWVESGRFKYWLACCFFIWFSLALRFLWFWELG